jgi:hypothetical protein
MNDLDTIKAALSLCQSKGWTDAVRLLDLSEVLGTAWGESCTLHVLDYQTGEWILCTADDRDVHSMEHLYRFIRSELAWAGPVRLALASQ